jgi:peptidoglycan/xylan/chitin deacetylase (PgdA/CDA1 family)
VRCPHIQRWIPRYLHDVLFATERASDALLDCLAAHTVEMGISFVSERGVGAESWHMVENMLESGLKTLGVHSHAYRGLRHLGPSEVEEEVSTSKELIAKRIGVDPRSCAYRWGYWSAVVEPLLPERYATAVLGGPPNPERRPSPNRLHRYPVRLSGGVAPFRRESGTVSDSKNECEGGCAPIGASDG